MRWIANFPLHIDVLLVGNETEAVGFAEKFISDTVELTGRGRDAGFPAPPAQIRTCALTQPARNRPAR